MLRLSKRLEQIAGQVPAGSRMADIGSDHALLPSFLAEQGRITKGIAGEVNPGPYQAASKQVRDANLQAVIDVRFGDGLQVIAPNEVDVITIAGMGGVLIAAILDAGIDKLAGVSKLILQPNVGENLVRSWLMEHDWVLTDEQILEEDGKIYEILTAEPANIAETANPQLYAERILAHGVTVDPVLLMKLGPYFIQKPTAVWFRKWKLELAKLDRICRQLELSTLSESRTKRQEVESEMKQIEEVIACLQKDKPSSD